MNNSSSWGPYDLTNNITSSTYTGNPILSDINSTNLSANTHLIDALYFDEVTNTFDTKDLLRVVQDLNFTVGSLQSTLKGLVRQYESLKNELYQKTVDIQELYDINSNLRSEIETLRQTYQGETIDDNILNNRIETLFNEGEG